MSYGQSTPLRVPHMLKPILDNYDAHVENFRHFLHSHVKCKLVYDGPFDIHQHIRERTVYACSVQHQPTRKILRNVFPIMLGSKLDLAIRHCHVTNFEQDVPTPSQPPFEKIDIGRGFFIISGFLRQVPYFYTNDPTQSHVIPNVAVCVFTYDALDKGKKLSYYIRDEGTKQRGDMVMVGNDGTECNDNIDSFFDFCPYLTDSATYMTQVYRQNAFDIDSLVNKIVISPGHLFTKLFVKYLYTPLRNGKWTDIKSKWAMVIKSIETGCLLHVLSRKTTFQQEGTGVGKMTSLPPQEQQREIGADGEMFVEKSIGCYREVNMQTYPLNPFLNYIIVRQTSSKVKVDTLEPFPSSYIGYLCILGCFETKNVGRTTMMVRDTIVSTCNALDPVFHPAKQATFWLALNLDAIRSSIYFVVVNEACIPVTFSCFRHLDLLQLKREFKTVECYQDGQFIYIRYKMGLFFKLLPGTDVWVTPKDIIYWSTRLLQLTSMSQLVKRFGFSFETSYLTDLNPFFNYNHFPKNILGFNALKNAVLALDSSYHVYFMDSLSAYGRGPTRYHVQVQEPEEDGVSPHFVLKVPQVLVAYMNFRGLTQEDSIVCRKDVDAFHCCRFYTIRVKLEADGLVRFQPVAGDVDPSPLLGTIAHFGDMHLRAEPYSIHVTTKHVTSQSIQLFFRKTPFRVLHHYISANVLSICVEQDHFTSTGDKVCTFHGQKGVMTLVETLPTLDGVEPDLLVNAYSLFRITCGQIKEGEQRGGGKDALIVRNVNGKVMYPSAAFYARTMYFGISYWAAEHIYYPVRCTMDKISNQPVKGRSRCGGMRLGNMEIKNGMQGNGVMACNSAKTFKDGVEVTPDEESVTLPKSTELVIQDCMTYKCHLVYKTCPNVVVEKVNQI